MAALTNRHDILILFDVTNGNPNGDPDAGNLPRIDPTTNKGLVSDVCIKRKIRNYVSAFCRTADGKPAQGLDILVQQGNVLNREINSAITSATEKMDKKATSQQKAEAAMKWLCSQFYDVRAFGGVLSTGDDVLKGSAYGQVRGPVQVTFARSFHAITPLEISVTRCAVTKEEDIAKERTMGNKHIVPYALYLAKIFVSPVFAERTGFMDDDLALLCEALSHMFDHDQSAARPEMTVRAIYDFEHFGTQDTKNADQNAREARLGCEHAHKLFAGVRIAPENPAMVYPESFEDYDVTDVWTGVESGGTVVPGVRLFRRVDPRRNGV